MKSNLFAINESTKYNKGKAMRHIRNRMATSCSDIRHNIEDITQIICVTCKSKTIQLRK